MKFKVGDPVITSTNEIFVLEHTEVFGKTYPFKIAKEGYDMLFTSTGERFKGVVFRYPEITSIKPLKQSKKLKIKNRWNNFCRGVNELAHEKGWYDEPRELGTMIALCHSELSEALEALRGNGIVKASKKIPNYTEVEEELADVVIRIMDMAHENGWDVGGAIEAKHEYNKTREYKHGGKRF